MRNAEDEPLTESTAAGAGVSSADPAKAGGPAFLADGVPSVVSATEGAYVLVEDRWVSPPRNDAQVLAKRVPSDLAEDFDQLFRDDGWAVERSKHIVGEVLFRGGEPVPILPAAGVVIAYVGALPARAAGYPVMELAPLRTSGSGLRRTPLSEEAPQLEGFGVRRVGATIEQPAGRVTVLRCAAALAPGRYALACGRQFFELAVR